jgi:hypothetical protein
MITFWWCSYQKLLLLKLCYQFIKFTLFAHTPTKKKKKNMWSQIDIQHNNKKGIHWSKELSTESVWSFLKIPFCPITWAALGACTKAFSRAAFHSYKSSIVSACKTNKKVVCQHASGVYSYFCPIFFGLGQVFQKSSLCLSHSNMIQNPSS